MQQVRHGAHLLAQLLHQVHSLIHVLLQTRSGRGHLARDVRQVQSQRGEGLSCAVVQLAGNTPALVILNLQKAPGEPALLLGLPLNVHIAALELERTRTHFNIQPFSQAAESLFTVT
jgi:hypothetical protein